MIVPTFACIICVAPIASADPAVEQRDATCTEPGSKVEVGKFTAEYVNPPQAGGLPNTFRIADGEGVAEGAGRLSFHEITILLADGRVIHRGDAASTVGRQHTLFACSYPELDHPGDTITVTGFFIP